MYFAKASSDKRFKSGDDRIANPKRHTMLMQLTRYHRFIPLSWQVLLILISACFVLFFVYQVLANYWPGPYEDYWADMPLIEGVFKGSATFDQLIIAHNNAHRIVIPRLFFMADYKFASGTNTLLIGTALLVKLGLVYFFNRQIIAASFTTRLLLNTLIIMAVFNGALVYNTVFNINIQWDMMILFSLISITSFYHYCLITKNSLLYVMLAYLLFFCAALTHAGGYFCLPIFWLIAFNQRKYLDMILPTLFFVIIFYLAFFVLPLSHPDGTTYEEVVMHQFTMMREELLHFIMQLSIGIHADFPRLYIYFSCYVLLLASFNAVVHRKLTHRESSLWIYLAIFLCMVMFVAAAARVGWIWSAAGDLPRFKALSLCLLIILTIHCILLTRHFANEKLRNSILVLVVGHSAALMGLAHYSNYKFPFVLSNNMLATHAYMLFKGADRINGRWLGNGILFREEQDPVVHFDLFFKKNGYAYYANKVVLSDQELEAKKIGDQLIHPEMLDEFSKKCSINHASMEISSDDGIPAIFSTEINSGITKTLLASINRNSYFVLNSFGGITGYAYTFVNPDFEKTKAYLRGFSNTQDIQYIAEIVHNKAACLYQINPDGL